MTTKKKLTKSLIIGFFIILLLSPALYSAEKDKAPLRDPMVPPDLSIFDTTPTKMVKRSPFKIQGIGRSEKDAYVIIGGKVYREGETKGEITIVKITGTAVDILVNGSPETLIVNEK